MKTHQGHVRPVTWLGIAALSAFAVFGCGDKESNFEPTPGVTLVATPTAVSLNSSVREVTVLLTTSPAGRLSWNVISKPAWLKVTPENGRIDLKTVEVKFSAIDSLMPNIGLNFGAVQFASEGGLANISVHAQAEPRPVATLSSTTLAFGQASDTASTVLRNTGRGSLTWTASPSAAWLKVAPATGTLNTGDSVRLVLTANREPLPVGTSNASVTITSNSTTGPVTLNATVPVAAIAGVRVSSMRLSYPFQVSQQSFYIVNTGKAALTWTVQPSAGWLMATPVAGTTAVRDSTRITVDINRALNAPTGTLTIKSNAPAGDVVIEALVGLNPISTSTPILLSHRVIDAEYASTGAIVTVSASPARLHIIDPETGVGHTVELSKTPTSVSVSPNGLFAAVGHDAAVSYVNLSTRTVQRLYPTTIDVMDVILGDRGWMYLLPRRDQWESVYSINLATGVQEARGTIYAGTVGKLHPSGDYLYLANRGLSPSDIEKFDVRTGIATAMYDSPYHGDHEFAGDLWFFEDGTRLIARSGNSFRTSEVRAEDLTYAGRLSGLSYLQAAEHSKESQRIYAFQGSWDGPVGNELWVFDSQFMALRNRVTLPNFFGATQSRGMYVFANAAGTRLYLLVKADPAGGIANDWAYMILDAAPINQ